MSPPANQQQISPDNTRSTTITVTETQAPSIPLAVTSGTLVLRAEPAEQRHIQWADDVVDNEGMGRKSSKVCCIYHKPHAVDESSSDDSSSSSSDESDSDSSSGGPEQNQRNGVGDGGARRSRGRRKHQHDDACGKGGDRSGSSKKANNPSPNAYERMPKPTRPPKPALEEK